MTILSIRLMPLPLSRETLSLTTVEGKRTSEEMAMRHELSRDRYSSRMYNSEKSRSLMSPDEACSKQRESVMALWAATVMPCDVNGDWR